MNGYRFIDFVPHVLVMGTAVLILTVYKLFQISREPEYWRTRAILEDRRVKVRTDWNLYMGSRLPW
ncbi:MAG: hypothetical protein JRN33_03955 [Nitrososphaerota archaeon]|jgi:hypothetical protein|nr:hypothetical protein [Nitrososphaerota archaeon]MDG6955395.1 hypothetical protein [Nitrososphaerota archaeon]